MDTIGGTIPPVRVVSFRWRHDTFQIQITKSQDAVPLTRDYMTRLEDTASRPKTTRADNSRAA